MHVTPSTFFRRILRSEALVYKSSFFSEQSFYGNYSTLDSHTNIVISHAFAYSSRWRRKPWQGLLAGWETDFLIKSRDQSWQSVNQVDTNTAWLKKRWKTEMKTILKLKRKLHLHVIVLRQCQSQRPKDNVDSWRPYSNRFCLKLSFRLKYEEHTVNPLLRPPLK